MELYKLIDQVEKDDPFIRLVSSERLTRDVEHLMSSSYWIDQLKASKASGIGNRLFYQLNESQQFVNEFVKYSVNTQKVLFWDLIFKSLEVKNSNDKLNSKQLGTFINTDINNNNNYSFQIQGFDSINNRHDNVLVKLPIEFLIECIFLAILDLEDYIGNINDIATKFYSWFPEIQKSASFQIKPLIESVLNSTPCFKRLINYNRATPTNRPIILGKRQYIWSINQTYLKPFVRYFYKCGDKKVTFFESQSQNKENSCIELHIPTQECEYFLKLNKNLMPLSNSNFTYFSTFSSLFSAWKFKVDQFKLLIQLKHSNYGFSWYEPVLSPFNKHMLNKIDFMKLGTYKTSNKPRAKQSNTDLSRIDLLKAKKKPKYEKSKERTKNETKMKSKSKIEIEHKQEHKQEILEFSVCSKDTLQVETVKEMSLLANDFENGSKIIQSNEQCSQAICDNSVSSQNCSYFNLLSIPSLSVAFSSGSNFLNNHHQNLNLSMIETNAPSTCVDQFLTNEEEDLRIVTSDHISIEHDKFIYF